MFTCSWVCCCTVCVNDCLYGAISVWRVGVCTYGGTGADCTCSKRTKIARVSEELLFHWMWHKVTEKYGCMCVCVRNNAQCAVVHHLHVCVCVWANRQVGGRMCVGDWWIVNMGADRDTWRFNRLLRWMDKQMFSSPRGWRRGTDRWLRDGAETDTYGVSEYEFTAQKSVCVGEKEKWNAVCDCVCVPDAKVLILRNGWRVD